MKWIVRIGIGGLLLVLLIKMLSGRYINLWGLEINKKYADTVLVNNPPIYRDTGSTKIVYTSIPSYNKPLKPGVKDTSKSIQQTNTNGNNQVNQVNGSNSGINGNVTINNGMKQRHLDDNYAKMFLARLTDTLNAHGLSRNAPIRFGSTMGSNEAFEFTKEVVSYLRSIGFSNISNEVYTSMNGELLIVYVNNKIHIDVGMMQ